MQLAIAVVPHVSAAPQTYEEQGDQRLKKWAEWSRGDDGALGYPKVEPFTRLVTPAGGGPTGPMPDDVAETDRAVCVIKNRDRSVLWRAICQFYLRNDAINVSMRECSVSRAGYYRLVKRAQRKVMELVRSGTSQMRPTSLASR